ncbi:MAG: hypothetical protein F6K47_07250 [Symploca sp. SIO2E6]|nr:hypothetical protein [Symploca sp. SIO2E6]
MKQLSKILFLMNGIYFVCMAVAHFFSLKYPILFIYYNVPFYAYQDKIISFAVVAYVALFFEASRKIELRSTAIKLFVLG